MSESSEGSKREVVWPSSLEFKFYLTTRKAFPDQQNLNFTSIVLSIYDGYWTVEFVARQGPLLKASRTVQEILEHIEETSSRCRKVTVGVSGLFKYTFLKSL